MLAKSAFASLLIALVSTSVAAQEYGHCERVYDGATRDLRFAEGSYSELNTVFDAYCSASGEFKSSEGSVGIEAVIKKIPIKFTGSGSSASERMSSFCRDYGSVRFSTAASSTSTSTVVVAALEAFNQCIDLSRRNVSITYTSPNNLSSSFSFQFTNNIKYEFQGMTSDGAIKCSTVQNEGAQPVDLSPDSFFEATKNFTISCMREAQNRPDGGRYFPRTSVTFGSNHGNFSAIFPAEEVVDVEFASALANRMAAIEARTASVSDTTNAGLEEIRNAVTSNKNVFDDYRGRLTVKSFLVGRGEHRDRLTTGFIHIGCNDVKPWVEAQCPGMKTDILDLGTFGGNRCGYSHYIATCVSSN